MGRQITVSAAGQTKGDWEMVDCGENVAQTMTQENWTEPAHPHWPDDYEINPDGVTVVKKGVRERMRHPAATPESPSRPEDFPRGKQ